MTSPELNSGPDWSAVQVASSISEVTSSLNGIILAAGFEERSCAWLKEGSFHQHAQCVLIRFRNNVPGNGKIFDQYVALAKQRFAPKAIHVVELHQDAPNRMESELGGVLSSLPRSVMRLGVDISGMPSYAACMALKCTRFVRNQHPMTVLYTAAKQYNPTFSQYRKLIAKQGGDIELLPDPMALEMRETLILDSFSGYRSQNAKTCLAIMAGYEAHRSTGVVDTVNPSLLLLLYGNPGAPELQWRLDLSRRLHTKFEKGRRTAETVVSTLHFQEALSALETFYDKLIDDYDLVIAPIGSKMQTLATYLFWERYPEVQLNFPLPIGYDPMRRPTGTGLSFHVEIEPRQSLFKNAWPASA